MSTLQGELDRLVPIVVESLPEYIEKYFNEHIAPNRNLINAIEHEMGDWYELNKESDTSVSCIVKYILESSFSMNSDVNVHLKSYMEMRRNQKKYWFKTIKEELNIDGLETTKRNKRFVNNDYERFLLYSKTHKVTEHYDSREDFILKRYSEIEKWAKTQSSPLCDYTYIRLLSDNSQAKAFIIDTACELFNYIKEDMYGNPMGFATSLPSEVFDLPFFGYRQERLSLETEREDDNINVIDKYFYGDNTVATIVKTFNISEQFGVVEDVENMANRETMSTYRSFDTSDLQLLAILCSSITVDTFSNDIVEMPLTQLASQFYRKSNLRGRDLVNCLNHVDKMARYTMQAEHYQDGMYEKILLHFYDVHYRIPAEQNERERNIDKEMADVIKDSELSKNLDFDLSKAVVQFSIGKTIKDAWKDSKISQVYSKLYHLIDSQEPKAKSFLFILENERLRIYPELEIERLPYSFFTDKLRFSNMKPNKIKGEIDKTIRLLQDQNILIDKYSMEPMGVHIRFLPFSYTEKLVYNIPVDKNSVLL